MNVPNTGTQNSGDTTPVGNGSPVNQNGQNLQVEGTTQKTNGEGNSQKPDSGGQEGKIVVDGKEYAIDDIKTALKKATDFDRAVELKRLAKLEKRNQQEPNRQGGAQGDNQKQGDSPLSLDEIRQVVAETLDERLKVVSQASYNQNLAAAYRDFLKKHKWADKDEVIEVISQNFNPEGAEDKGELLARLEDAALRSFPSEYRKAQEEVIKAELLAQERNLAAGDGIGSSVKSDAIIQKQLTKEQIEMAKRMGNDPREVYPEYFPQQQQVGEGQAGNQPQQQPNQPQNQQGV